jgi:predicted Zn-dependent protease
VPADGHYEDYRDGYTAAIHELGHALGIHEPTPFPATPTGSNTTLTCMRSG